MTGDTWDDKPALKLRVLKLMFKLMVRENERIQAAARSAAATTGVTPGAP